MARLPIIRPEQATGKAQELLNAVQKKLGLIPNMTRVMVNSPAVLEAYIGFSGALAARKGGLTDGELAEVAALTALNVFTNYFNIAFQVDVDFPKVTPARHAAV